MCSDGNSEQGSMRGTRYDVARGRRVAWQRLARCGGQRSIRVRGRTCVNRTARRGSRRCMHRWLTMATVFFVFVRTYRPSIWQAMQ